MQGVSMGSVSAAVSRQTVNVQAFQFSHFRDIDLYRRTADSAAMVPVIPAERWKAQMESLARSFPDIGRPTLALAILALYLCRTTEDGEATIPLWNSLNTTFPDLCSVIQVAIEGRESFASFVQRVASQHLGSLALNEQRIFNREHNPHMVVTCGTYSEGDVVADIHFHIDENGMISCRVAAYIDPEFAGCLQERLVALAQGVAHSRFRPVIAQPVMSIQEMDRVLNIWNETSVNYGYDGGLVAMMETSVNRDPKHPAVIFRGEEISYEDFNARANRLARRLQEMGVGKDSFVCLCMERGFELVVGIWAVLKAGAAYVPLNTDDPESRIAEIISDCEPVAVLCQHKFVDKLPADAPVVTLDEETRTDGDYSADNIGVYPEEDALAYMIYTSGSTGKPKGVTVEHEAIHNRVEWMHREYGLDPQDRVLQKTPYTFDVSVWEFLWPLAVGSTMVVAEPGGHVAMRYLYEVIKTDNVTHLHFVPSVFRLFLMLPDLSELPIKKLFCSGEALSADTVETFYKKANQIAEVHNLYGPTEAAVDVSYYHCRRNMIDDVIPIGKPVANTGLYVLDRNDRPTPIGIPGELHIGGVQLARGYWAREELTAERFVPSTVEEMQHRRLYRTGDLAYLRPDGQIVYLGRNDFQVKINGVRIELGEIESVIRADPDTKDVVVVAEECNGNKILVAYVVSRQPSSDKGAALKKMIADSRPPYYVPRELHFIEEMPLTVSGKIDRKLLRDTPRL